MSTPTVAELEAATEATAAAIESGAYTSPPRPRRPSTRRSSPARATSPNPNPNRRLSYEYTRAFRPRPV